ncbi:MAG: cadmium-translocating P-type ATPase [Bacteroidetes bacterium]|nr:cadmium-translocating P-type ATPase [Bacteroidota bacterium]
MIKIFDSLKISYFCSMQQSIQCKVDGMTCGNCALTITNYLNKKGVTDAVANASTGDVSFVIEEGLDVDSLYDGIDNLGFKVLRGDEEETQTHSSVKPFLIIASIFWVPLMAHMFIPWKPLHAPLTQLILVLPVFIIGTIYFGKSAFRSLMNGIPNMDVLVFIGATAAFIYSITGWILHPEAVHQYLFFETTASIITLVLAGNFLEEYAVQSTASSIKELMKYQKTSAKLILTDSIGKVTITNIDHDEVKLQDILQVNTGDKIPVDGIITQGNAAIDESMMTGESIPNAKGIGDSVTGGTILTEGNIQMKATAIGNNTALSTIIKLVHQAQATKPPMQKLADKISAVFVPLVIGVALLTFLLNYFAFDVSFQNSMMRTIAVMVIACPCAMGLATPAAVMVGLGRAARNGILIKGGDTLEKFKDIKQFVFDKTGTLTTGQLKIDQYQTTLDEKDFKNIVYSLEQFSSHPIAKSICKEWVSNTPISFTLSEEIKGIGLKATDHDQNEWQLGSYRLLNNTSSADDHDLYLLKNNEIAGWIDMKDELRPEAKSVIEQLNAKGYRTLLLSGDRKETCEKIASTLGIAEVFSEQLPADKLNTLQQIMQSGRTVMVGDGINDAPALAKADIGISLSDASQIAMQSAQVILLKNNLSLLPQALFLGKHTFITIKQNLFWAFFYNIVAIPIAASGLLTPTWGAGIMALSDIVLIINSLRLKYKKVH